jgi:hypothetical protein
MGLSMAGSTAFGFTLGVHTMLAGSLLTILGYQAASLAVFSSVAGDPIREPTDPITGAVKRRFRLEHGATLGVALLLLGSGYVGVLAWQWVASGFTAVPSVVGHVFGFTLAVLGLQTVFHSFFLSVLGSARDGSRIEVDDLAAHARDADEGDGAPVEADAVADGGTDGPGPRR